MRSTTRSCARSTCAAPRETPAVKLAAPGAPHLTYCTNIHPGETLARGAREPRARTCRRCRQRSRPTRPSASGCGSRRAAADELATPAELAELQRVARRARPLRLHHQRLSLRRVPRHAREGGRLRARLARPPSASRYSDRARRAPRRAPARRAGYGSVSTVPGAFAPDARSPDAHDAIARGGMIQHVKPAADSSPYARRGASRARGVEAGATACAAQPHWAGSPRGSVTVNVVPSASLEAAFHPLGRGVHAQSRVR